MVDRLSPEEVARRLREDPDSLLLLDIREPEERAVAAIEPSLHIPMGEVIERLVPYPQTASNLVCGH